MSIARERFTKKIEKHIRINKYNKKQIEELQQNVINKCKFVPNDYLINHRLLIEDIQWRNTEIKYFEMILRHLNREKSYPMTDIIIS
jgi:hypothetical protein